MTNDAATIIPSAVIPAELRRRAGLPYAAEIAKRIDTERELSKLGLSEGEHEILKEFVLLTEARYHAVSRILGIHKDRNVFEVAAGYSSRVLAMTDKERVTYVTSDLRELADASIKVVCDIEKALRQPRGQIHSFVVDVFDGIKVERALMEFERPPRVAVIVEGLFPHFTKFEKWVTLAHIGDQLMEGDVVIVPDMMTKPQVSRMLDDNSVRKVVRKITDFTARQLVANAYDSVREIRDVASERGYKSFKHSLADVAGKVRSAKQMGLGVEDVRGMLRDHYVWELRAV